MSDIVEYSKSNCAVPVYLFEGNFPLIMTFFAVHCYHRVQSSAIFESKLLSILDTFSQMFVPVYQQVFSNLPVSGFQEKWQTKGLSIPICTTSVFLTGKSLWTYIEPFIFSSIGLVKMEYVETNRLLGR